MGSFAPSHSEHEEGGSFRFNLSSPQLSAPRPDSDGLMSHSERLSRSRGPLGKQAAPRRSSEQDATMSSMLAQLRSENSTSSSTTASKRQSHKSTLFMTQDGATAGVSLMEGDLDEEEDSDSDVSLSDFKQPPAVAKVKTPPAAAGHATAAHMAAKQKLRGQFSDSFQDEVEPAVRKVSAGDIDTVLHRDGMQDDIVSVTSEDAQSLSIMAIDSAQASFITSNPHGNKDEIDLKSAEYASVIIS